MVIEPAWFDEIVPPDDREAVRERIQKMNEDGLREWFTFHYWDAVYRYLRNWFEIDHEEPFDVDVEDIPEALRASSPRSAALMIVLEASQKENIRIDWDTIEIEERVIDWLYWQLGWLNEVYITYHPYLPEFRWSTNDPDFGKGWQIRPLKKLVQMPNSVWLTRTVYEKHYQPTLKGL